MVSEQVLFSMTSVVTFLFNDEVVLVANRFSKKLV